MRPPMHRTVQVTFLVTSSIALGILLWMRPVAATAAGAQAVAASPAAADPAGMADRFYNQKASALIEPLPTQF
jgi:hypothetical protein